MHRRTRTASSGWSLALLVMGWVCAACGGGQEDSGAGNSAGVAGLAGAGTGGAGASTSGGAPHVVQACDSLPAAGTWEEIGLSAMSPAPAYLGSQGRVDANDVTVDPTNPATVFVGFNHAGIYRSDDCGAHFVKVNTGRNGEHLDDGGPWNVIVDPVDHGTLYVVIGYGSNNFWKSTNGGVDWDPLIVAGTEADSAASFFNGASMDPEDHLHLVLTPHQQCGPGFEDGCFLETFDGGASWKVLKSGGLGFAEGGGPYIISRDLLLVAIPFGGLFLTDDHGATYANVAPELANGATGGGNGLYRAPDGTWFMPSLGGVMQSPDARTWTLIPESGGITVGLAGGRGQIFASDQWHRVYRTASLDDLSFHALESDGLPVDDQGAPYLAFDVDHGLLYSTNFNGGFWRYRSR